MAGAGTAKEDRTDDIEEPFTARELARSCGQKGKSFSTEALILRKMGVIEQTGKKGRSYLYRVAEDPQPVL